MFHEPDQFSEEYTSFPTSVPLALPETSSSGPSPLSISQSIQSFFDRHDIPQTVQLQALQMLAKTHSYNLTQTVQPHHIATNTIDTSIDIERDVDMLPSILETDYITGYIPQYASNMHAFSYTDEAIKVIKMYQEKKHGIVATSFKRNSVKCADKSIDRLLNKEKLMGALEDTSIGDALGILQIGIIRDSTDPVAAPIGFHSFGVFAAIDIPQNALLEHIVIYKGLLKTSDEYQYEVSSDVVNEMEHFYAFDLSCIPGIVLDSTKQRNVASFINDYRGRARDIEPNVDFVEVYAKGIPLVLIHNNRAIKKGEQLLIEYGDNFWTAWKDANIRSNSIKRTLEKKQLESKIKIEI